MSRFANPVGLVALAAWTLAAGCSNGTGPGGTCANACTNGASECLSENTVQVCAVGNDGCTHWTTSTCGASLICARSAPVGCADPRWAAWPMPNTAVDVAAGAPFAMAYTVNGDGTVTDKVTALMWQQAAPADSYDLDGAAAYCPALTLGGHVDWRVPTEIELLSLVDESIAGGPTINADAFPGTLGGYYWSSLPMADAPDNQWLVDFNTGGAYDGGKADLLYVRCVR